MKFLKTAGLGLVGIVAIYYLIRLLTSTPDYELNNANQAFLQGDFNRAQRELSDASSAIPHYKFHLYQGYIDRGLNHLPSSDDNFTKAIEEAKIRQLPQVQLEAYLNLTLNAYLEKNIEKFETNLHASEALDPTNAWVVFFQGLRDYQKKDYNKAIEAWSKTQDRPPLSLWMKKSFEDVFTPEWSSINVSKVQIETGNVVKARDTLMQQSRQTSGKGLDDINYLIGYSFIKEGENTSPEALLTYIKLAIPYLQKLPPSDPRFESDKKVITDTIVENIRALSTKKSIPDITPVVKYLQLTGATEALVEIKNILVGVLEDDIQLKNSSSVVDVSTALEQVDEDHEQKEAFSLKLMDVVNQMLESGQVKGVTNFWQASKILSASPANHERDMVDILENKILTTIKTDDNNLSKSKPYLIFWYQLSLNPREKELFANQILEQAEASWGSLNEPEKGFALIKIVYNLYPQENKEAINAKLIPLLDKALSKSIDQDNIVNIEQITFLAQDLKLKLPSQQMANTAPKVLAHAHDQYIKKNWQDAKKHSDWILLADPGNEQALEISGLSEYQLAHYNEAIKFLSKISRPSQEVSEALAVSQVISGNKAVGMEWITKTQTRRPLSHDAYLRLGFGALIEKNPQLSQEWFSHIAEKDGELAVAEIYTQYLLGNWQNAYDQVQQLKTPYSQLDGVQAIGVKSLIALDKVDRAEKDLRAFITLPPVTDLSKFTPPFIQFKNQVLDKFSRDYIAGDFYLEVKKDGPKALEYFSKIKDPTPEVNYDMGMINISQMKFSDALTSLQKASLQNEDIKIKNLAIPLLAHLYLTLHREYDAFPWYQAYVNSSQDDIEARHLYATVLMFINRYDLALEQFNYLTLKKDLSVEEQVAQVEAQAHLLHFNEARDLATRLLKSKALDTSKMLNFGNTLIILNMVGSVEPIASDLFVKRADIKDPAILFPLTKLFLNLGAYSQVEELVKVHSDLYNTNQEGLLLLAEYNQRLSRKSEALGYAQQAFERDPESQKVITYLSTYETNIELLKSFLAEYKKKVDTDPSNITAVINYAETFFRLAYLYAENPDKISQDYSLDLQNVSFITSKLVDMKIGIPKLDFLQGMSQYYLSNYKDAIKYFDKTLKVDPSSLEANRFFALSAEKLGSSNLAPSRLKTALSIAPYDASLWNDLAKTSLKLGDQSAAIVSYQQMIKFAPYDLIGYLSLGKIYLDLKNPEEAKKVLEEAVKVDPSNTQALSLLLRSLYDRDLSFSLNDDRDLVRQQAEVYSKLLKLDPENAQKLMTELTGANSPPKQETKSDK